MESFLPVSRLPDEKRHCRRGEFLAHHFEEWGSDIMNTGIETTNEHVLIVGGSSGMGLALARILLSEGARVTIAGRSEARLEEARTNLSPITGRLQTEVADITQEEQVARLFERIGPLDHIVTTAADIEGAYQLLPSQDVAAAQRVVGSKFIGPLLLAKHGAPVLAPQGSITFTSGIAAYRPVARGSVVAAINGALESLAYALAVELGPIRVNAVSPGWVDSPIWTHVAGEAKAATLEAMAKRLPVGRIGQPDDIASAIRFLMRNGFVTGTVLHVDGGHRLI
ncbi:SDR family oxidoreductase [Azospirillum sp. A1-3]|uniref:SDR family oxidoreductase n=1 Tax=Azospirillum sp. A1-3 TaxID=185874 RepID=UPI00207710B0|nr:SDR family oxidoreductase [Azospirillum sp. A1-3]MCM8739025.1 SDR family oxidoreductase [Azospirillum sp. A1-3]